MSNDYSKAVLEKTIERDATLVMHGFSARVLNGDNRFGFGANVQRPVYVSFATAENIQLWENQYAIAQLKEAFLARNSIGTDFMEDVARDQRDTFAELERYWQSGTVADEHIDEYIDLLKRAIMNCSIYYYSGLDERTPESVLKTVLDIRREDELYAKGDEFMRTFTVSRGIERELAPFILPDELHSLPEAATLQKRAEGTVFRDGVEIELGSLEAYAARHSEIEFRGLHASAQLADSVTGRTAFPGIVRGVARIVKNRNQAALVQDGDVIVSPMTTPDFIDAMKRAAAFVTDEGGITCHAAIVAREMQKPCVIGTQFATKVFKDGDVIEVDAEKGTVRKL